MRGVSFLRVASALGLVLVLTGPFGGFSHALPPGTGLGTVDLSRPTLSGCLGSDWPTYLGNSARDSDAFGERAITPLNAGTLAELWNVSTGRPVPSSAAIVHGTVYIGSWNGYEYALNASNGALRWKSFLGTDPLAPRTMGITSSATVDGPTLYVSGGGSFFYALNRTNGNVLWKFFTGNVSKGFYDWASPLIADGYAYLGLSSYNDAAVRGAFVQVSLNSHKEVHRFNTTGLGTVGSTIWTSPAFDPASNSVFVTTGNAGTVSSTYAESILRFNATTLSLTGNWSVPAAQASPDGDFGATPLLFTNTHGTPLVEASNKNGLAYAWNRSNLSAGPVWHHRVAPPSTPTQNGDLGPAAWGGGRIFVGTSRSNISGTLYNGSLQALVAGTGNAVWRDPLPAGAVLAAPAYANGVVVTAAGGNVYVVNALNGSVLFHFMTHTSATFWGAPAISHGEIVIGSSDGRIYAFALKSCVPGGGQVLGIPPTPSGPRPIARTD